MRGTLIYIAYRLVAGLIGPLPPQIGYPVAARIGGLFYRFSPGLRRVVTHNLRHVLGPEAGEEEVEAVVRQACVNIAKGHYELVRLPRLTVAEIDKIMTVEGIDRLLTVLERGKGAVVVSAHLGNVDLVGQLPMAYGFKISGAIEHIQPERLFRYLLEIRRSHGVTLIPSDESMIPLFRALKRGEIVALPSDRDITENGQLVEFFGAPARLPDGAVRVALRTGAALMPVFVERLPGDNFCIHVDPELELPHTGDREADITAGLEMVVKALERRIGMNPGQWLVASPVWPMDVSSQ